MTPTVASGLSVGWLALREPADAAARSKDLAEVVSRTPHRGPLEVHDLGAGTGSMTRWLAPQMPGPQHWVLHDRDRGLLEVAMGAPPRDAEGRMVSMASAPGEVDDLTAGDLAGATVITASALLDMLTAAQIERLCTACAGSRAMLLLTTTVDGEVELHPADPLDPSLRRAFNDHQRRTGLLGPDAAALTSTALASRGYRLTSRRAPWRLGPADAGLTRAWLQGWVGAAVDQRPMVRTAAAGYLRRRIGQLDNGELRVVVGHVDLLAEPDRAGAS